MGNISKCQICYNIKTEIKSMPYKQKNAQQKCTTKTLKSNVLRLIKLWAFIKNIYMIYRRKAKKQAHCGLKKNFLQIKIQHW